MWHLLKTEWKNNILAYLIPFIFPGSFFFYKIIQSPEKWIHTPPIKNIISLLIGVTFTVAMLECKFWNMPNIKGYRQRMSRLPIAQWKLHAIRFLSGPTLYGSLLTLAVAIFLFLTRNQFGNLYLSVLAFHGILVSSQILGIMIEDLTCTWNSKDVKAFCILLPPIGFITACLFSFQLMHFDYRVSTTELIGFNLLPFSFLYISFYLHNRRKSFLF